MKMVTVLVKQLFGFTVTVMIGFSKFSNRQTTKEAQIVFVAIRIILFFLQTNDIAIVLDIVWKMRWFSEWVCGDNKVDTQVHDAFNDPFRVWYLCSFRREGKSLAAK